MMKGEIMAINEGTGIVVVGQNKNKTIKSGQVDELGDKVAGLFGKKISTNKFMNKVSGFVEDQSEVGRSFTGSKLKQLYEQVNSDFETVYGTGLETDVEVQFEDGSFANTIDELDLHPDSKISINSKVSYKTQDGALKGYLQVGLSPEKKSDFHDQQTRDTLVESAISVGATIVFPPAGLAYGLNASRKLFDKQFKNNSWFELSVSTDKRIEDDSDTGKVKNLMNTLVKNYHDK